MSTIKRIHALAAEILKLEATFGANGEPPNEEVAAKWLDLVSDFRVAHGLRKGYHGPYCRNYLRLPTDATVQCRLPSGVVEAHCSVVGRGGLGLLLGQTDLPVGTKIEIIEVEHLGKRFQLSAPCEVRWQQTEGADLRVGLKLDSNGTDAFSAWYLRVYREYLRALAREEVEPLIANESLRSGDKQAMDDEGKEGPARMLIVDDEPENVKLLERAFRDHFEIFTAPNGSAALELALRVKPQVVITDQRMPASSGVELLSSLRQHLPDTQRILITGYVDYSTLVQAVNLAMVHHYVEKPVHVDSLVSAVKALCEVKPPRSDT